MKQVFWVLLYLILAVTMGCAKSDISSKYLSSAEGMYRVFIFSDGLPSAEFQNKVNKHIQDSGKVNEVGYFSNIESSIHKDFNIEQYPTIIVVDTTNIVLRTNEINELQSLLQSNK